MANTIRCHGMMDFTVRIVGKISVMNPVN